jgi:GntR family transcriptional regulator
MINFSVTLTTGAPIYEQVVFAAKRAIVSGHLKKGDRFPSVRELSKELQINPNTGQKVISALVQEKLLEIRPGIGSVVCDPPKGNEEDRSQILTIELERLIIEAKKMSINKEDFQKAVEEHWK